MAHADEELNALIAKAKAAYDAMSPGDKWRHRREQAISWVYGQMQLSGSTISREQAEKVVDDMIAKGKLPNVMNMPKPEGTSVWTLLMSDEDYFL